MSSMQSKKLVVFARYTAEINAICNLLEKKKSEVLAKFQKLRGLKIFKKGDSMIMVGQIDAAGTGITLHASSCVVYYSLTYNYATYAQSSDRVHRIGQHHPCTYIHLVCPKTIDMQILESAATKGRFSKNNSR